jgi:excisionase family DNA binding protein
VSSTELLTVDEVAEVLRTTPNAVRIMVCRGSLPGVVRLGRRVLVRAEDLRRHLGLLQTQAPSGSASSR